MAVLDRFGGPRAWDLECEGEDEAYMDAARSRTCLDCLNASRCGRVGYEGVGWCREAGEFIFAEDGTVADQGLECLVVA